MSEEFGKRLRELRLQNDMSLRDLAEKTGISYSFIGSIEKGRFNPSRDTVVVLAKGLKTSAYDLLILAGFVPQENNPDEWPTSTVEEVVGPIDQELAEAMKKHGVTAFKLTAELLEKGINEEQLRELYQAILKLKSEDNNK